MGTGAEVDREHEPDRLDWATLSVTYNEVAPVASAPEPATLTLLGTGAALALLRRRRQKRQVV